MSTPSNPNVILVMADQWRRSALGFMGEDPVETPAFDRFAEESTVFTRAYTCSPLCTPARAALLTGKHPFRIDMMYNCQRLPVEEETIASVASAHGYDTAMIGKWHLDDHEPDDPGGDMWNALTPAGPRRLGFRFWYSYGCVHDHFRLNYLTTENEVIEEQGWQVEHEADMAMRYIRNQAGERPAEKPFFMKLSWAPPHNQCGGERYDPDGPKFQYVAPESFEAMYRGRDLPIPEDTFAEDYLAAAPGYFGAISAIDHEFDRLMACLEEEGLADNTLVVVTSDHGECLGVHQRWMKGVWYEESVAIPLMVRWPKHVPAGRTCDAMLNMPDLMPTLLSLMGCEIPEGRDGCDYAPVFLGEKTSTDQDVFFSYACGAPPPELTRYEFPIEEGRHWRGVRTRRYTYAIVDRRPNSMYVDPEQFARPFPVGKTEILYDNDADPYQTNPFYRGDGHDEIMNDLRGRVIKWLNTLKDPFMEETMNVECSDPI